MEAPNQDYSAQTIVRSHRVIVRVLGPSQDIMRFQVYNNVYCGTYKYTKRSFFGLFGTPLTERSYNAAICACERPSLRVRFDGVAVPGVSTYP